MLCIIWYHLYDFKNVKSTHGGVLLFVTLQTEACNFTKSNIPPWVFWIVQMVPNRATHHMKLSQSSRKSCPEKFQKFPGKRNTLKRSVAFNLTIKELIYRYLPGNFSKLFRATILLFCLASTVTSAKHAQFYITSKIYILLILRK